MEPKNTEAPTLKKEDLKDASGGQMYYSEKQGGYILCFYCGCKHFDNMGFVPDGPDDGHFEYKCRGCGEILHYKPDRGYY